jgi:hypothetical protein
VSFRYSTISNFHKCQKYYEFKEVLGLSDGIEKSGDVAFGSCLHLGVQDLFEGGNGLDVFTAFWELQKPKDLEYSRLDWEALDRMGHDLLEIFRDEHIHKFMPLKDASGALMLECKMHGSIGQHQFSGTVDAVAEHGDTYLLWTGKQRPIPTTPTRFNATSKCTAMWSLYGKHMASTLSRCCMGCL